jgi:hypothetical protein
MAILSLATLLVSADRPDPNALVWLFYLGFVLLVGGCCAYLSALFSFGGVARNFAALVAVGLYMYLTGSALVAAVWIWGLQDTNVSQNDAFLGPQFAGLAVMIVGATLIVFSRLLPTSARVPLPDILTPGLFGVLAFIPVLVLAFALLALNAALVALIKAPLPASAQTAVDQVSPIGPVIIAGVLTLLVVLLRRGVHAPLNVKLLALGAAVVVTLALFLRGPSNWSEPPVWGLDILLLALVGSLVVYFVSRNLTAPDASSDESSTSSSTPATTQPSTTQPAPQQVTPAPAPQDTSATTTVTWEEPRTGE